jgi:hypothetical protein
VIVERVGRAEQQGSGEITHKLSIELVISNFQMYNPINASLCDTLPAV